MLNIGANRVFRITYEAFSKFSNNLIRCRTFDDIAACFKINLKYLFNYHVFRASYQRNGRFIHLVATASETKIFVHSQAGYLGYELDLLNRGIPMQWTDLDALELPPTFEVTDTEKTLWGWHIKNDERQIIVSVLSGSGKHFNNNDIPFVKLVAENLESKLLEICLFDEVDVKNQKLEEAVHTINEKNSIISSIIEEQKQVIKDRTREIEEKNKTLLEISVLNAHNVREPLSRIIGLVSLVEYYNPDEIVSEIIPKIKISSSDLDSALKNIINMATAELSFNKAEEIL